MRHRIRLGCCLVFLGLAACGSTGTATPGGPTADATAPEPTGTSDAGSRFATLAQPIGGLAVETPPVDPKVPVSAPPAPAPRASGAFPAPEPLDADGFGPPPAPASRWTTPRDR